jgi:hypothetical protein
MVGLRIIVIAYDVTGQVSVAGRARKGLNNVYL